MRKKCNRIFLSKFTCSKVAKALFCVSIMSIVFSSTLCSLRLVDPTCHSCSSPPFTRPRCVGTGMITVTNKSCSEFYLCHSHHRHMQLHRGLGLQIALLFWLFSQISVHCLFDLYSGDKTMRVATQHYTRYK